MRNYSKLLIFILVLFLALPGRAVVEEIKDINPVLPASGIGTLIDSIGPMVTVHGEIFFTADDGVHGQELWKSDGTLAGTVLVKDINIGSESSDPSELTNINGMLYFSAYTEEQGHELWKSDGTQAGTIMVKDLYQGEYSSFPRQITSIKGKILFVANAELNHDGSDYSRRVIWESDGSKENTSISSINNLFTAFGRINGTRELLSDGQFLFIATAFELWRSDGSVEGTELVVNGIDLLGHGGVQDLSIVDQELYFYTYSTIDGGILNGYFYKSNGTAEGTKFIQAIDPFIAPNTPSITSEITMPTSFNNQLYFSMYDEFLSCTLYQLDEAEAVSTLSIHSSCNAPVVSEDTLFFAKSSSYGQPFQQLWKITGANSDPVLVKEFTQGRLSNLTIVGNILFFTIDDGVHGMELWRSDGTIEGTELVADIVAGFEGSHPANLHAFDGQLYFSTGSELANGSLWRTTENLKSSPALLTQIQTMNNDPLHTSGEISVPWLTVATRDIQKNDARISLERSEVADGNVAYMEEVGYVAVENGVTDQFLSDAGESIQIEVQHTEPKFIGYRSNCTTQAFINEYSESPIVLASMSSHKARDGGWLRRCYLDEGSAGFYVEEDRYQDGERRHVAESASMMVFSKPFHRDFDTAPSPWELEVGETLVRQYPSSGQYTQVAFADAFDQAPVVIVLPTEQGWQPSSVRIRNVTTTGFEMDIVEPAGEDGLHPSQMIHYLAVTPGEHYTPHGIKVSADSVMTGKTIFGGEVEGVKGWERIPFN